MIPDAHDASLRAVTEDSLISDRRGSVREATLGRGAIHDYLHCIVVIVVIVSLLCVLNADAMLNAKEPTASAISAEDHEFFEKEVRPLLVKRCFECHGGTKAAGGLSLASAGGWAKGGENGPAIVPGKPDESLLIQALNYDAFEMPPQDKGGKLPDDEIAILSKWVAMGAPDPRDGSEVLGGMTREEAAKWWAFQPLPEIPTVDLSNTFNADVKRIDDLIQYGLDQQALTPALAANKRTLLRRLSYNLTGLPPSPAEVAAFIADESPDAWSNAIERLLASPQYGVHWGRRWLDVVRYADTAGENTDRPLPHAWRYRNWVIDSFNRDLPFDQFVQMQLAGDLLPQAQTGPDRAEGIIATGYLAIARRFGHDIDKDMYLTHEDVIDNLGKNFLGLTLGCARCHDHKYDAVNAEDYYALFGIFDSTQFAFPGCEPQGQPRDLVPLWEPAEVDALMKPWQEKVAQVEAEKQRRQVASQAVRETITSNWLSAKRVLAESNVGEGASVPFEQRLSVRRGELLLLTVSPNENHGADSTLVEWTIRETTGSEQRQWSTQDIVDHLTRSNPLTVQDAVWSFIEIANDQPAFLTEKGDEISGKPALKKWSLGDTPSTFVNTAHEPVQVWTKLPARSFFVHPGPQRPVAVAWTSPMDGELWVSGRVADAHPAALDGVSFELSHLASPDLGQALADLGQLSVGLPETGPAPVIPVAYAVVDRQPKHARLHERGDPEKLGDEVPRRWLSVFGGTEVSADAGSGRR